MTQLQSPPRDVPTRRVSRKKLIVLGAIVIVVAAAIWGGTVLWHAHQTAQRDAANAAAGADALHDARQDIATLNTMDYRRVGADFQAWLSASTGTLNSQLAQSAAGLKQQFVATRAVTSGTITKARVAVADAAAGTATILGTEDQLVSFGSTHTTKHNGFDAQVSLTAAGWRLTSFTTAPITK